MAKTWIQSLSGKKLEPLALTVEMVGGIEEIAHSLAGEFRFTRQTRRYYSVAQHCVEGSRLLAPAFAGAFLLHELSEVYLPDIASPVKPSLMVNVRDLGRGMTEQIAWADLEKQHTHVMLESLGLSSIEPLIYSPEIKAMDLAMLATEKRDLCGAAPESWGLDVEPAAVDLSLPWAVLTPDQAEVKFLERFHELFGRSRAPVLTPPEAVTS